MWLQGKNKGIRERRVKFYPNLNPNSSIEKKGFAGNVGDGYRAPRVQISPAAPSKPS